MICTERYPQQRSRCSSRRRTTTFPSCMVSDWFSLHVAFGICHTRSQRLAMDQAAGRHVVVSNLYPAARGVICAGW